MVLMKTGELACDCALPLATDVVEEQETDFIACQQLIAVITLHRNSTAISIRV
jgi:hypothetical protein